jgi:hypothetical protein
MNYRNKKNQSKFSSVQKNQDAGSPTIFFVEAKIQIEQNTDNMLSHQERVINFNRLKQWSHGLHINPTKQKIHTQSRQSYQARSCRVLGWSNDVAGLPAACSRRS